MSSEKNSNCLEGIKILIDGHNLSLKKGTGISTYARNLSHALREIGLNVSVLYGKPDIKSKDPFLREIYFFDDEENSRFADKTLATRITIMLRMLRKFMVGIRINEIPVSGKIITTSFKDSIPYFDKILNSDSLYLFAYVHFYVTRRILKLKLKSPPDIAHWTYPVPIKIKGAYNVYTIHDLIPLKLPYTTTDNKRVFYDIVKAIAKYADRIVTVSESSKNDIIDLLGVPEGKVANTYQTVSIPDDIKNGFEKAPDRLSLEAFGVKQKKYLLFVGAIEPKKNVNRLIEAYLGANISIPLVLAGPVAWKSKKELALLRSLKNLQSIETGRIIQLEYVPFRMLINLIKYAKVLVFPSLYEGFGLPVLEAMSLGTPVITSNISSLPEVVGDAAVLVDPYNVEDIRRALIQISSDNSIIPPLVMKGLKQAEKFDMQSYIKRLTDLYGQLINQR